MSITALPTPPDRSDPATFSSRADAFLGALPTFATEANALATQANSDAAVASAAAIGTLAASGTSTDSLTIGTGSKSFTTQTGKAITAGMTMKWSMQSDAAKYMTGTVTSYDAGTGALVMNMTATNGSGTSSAWEGVVTAAAAAATTISRRAITSTDTVISSDLGKLIDITSGTFTLAGTAAATLGAGFFCYLRNSGTGIVTFDPASSETVDALATIRLYPGESLMLQCDGSNWHTVGRQRVVLIGTSTVGSPVASVDFETGFGDTELDTIRVEGYGVTHNGGVARIARLRLKFSGSYSATNYAYQGTDGAVTTTSSFDQTTTTAVAIQLNPNTYAVGAVWDMSVAIGNINTATNNAHRVDWSVAKRGGSQASRGIGGNSAGSTVQGVQVLMNADSISGGTFYVYGVRKS